MCRKDVLHALNNIARSAGTLLGYRIQSNPLSIQNTTRTITQIVRLTRDNIDFTPCIFNDSFMSIKLFGIIVFL